jgi:hypothetical protein
MQQTRATLPATLDAVLERITYANQETGYTVARVVNSTRSLGQIRGLSGHAAWADCVVW